jgi:hypothetical protein
MFLAAGPCLTGRCLTMNVYSVSAIPAFRCHVTISCVSQKQSGSRTTRTTPQEVIVPSTISPRHCHKPQSDKVGNYVRPPVHYVLFRGTERLCSSFSLVSAIRITSVGMPTTSLVRFLIVRGQHWYPGLNQVTTVSLQIIWNYPLSSNGLTLYSL